MKQTDLFIHISVFVLHISLGQNIHKLICN